METLYIDIRDLKDDITLKVSNWKNLSTTNCYAYALGLDIPEKNIIPNAYQVGSFTSYAFDLTKKQIDRISIEAKLLLDLDALGIEYKEVSALESLTFRKNYIEWKIALMLYYMECFDNVALDSNFHFLRQASDNLWYHKFSFSNIEPTNRDEYGNIITNPNEQIFEHYRLYKCYKLSIKIDN